MYVKVKGAVRVVRRLRCEQDTWIFGLVIVEGVEILDHPGDHKGIVFLQFNRARLSFLFNESAACSDDIAEVRRIYLETQPASCAKEIRSRTDDHAMYFELLPTADDGEVGPSLGVQQAGDINYMLRSSWRSHTFDTLEQAPPGRDLSLCSTYRVMMSW